MRVAYHGDLNAVQRLIANRANVNTKTENSKGYTTIVYAGTNNHIWAGLEGNIPPL